MDNETREQIALIRYKLISPVLAEPGRVQNEYFRTQAAKHHEFPRYGNRKVKVSTLKSWLIKHTGSVVLMASNQKTEVIKADPEKQVRR